MDYEKLYKEALERAREYHKVDYDNTLKLYARGTMEYIFPELKETEDEKVKRILHSISSKMSSHLRDIFTEEEFQCFDAWSNDWLEKQGEQKPVDFKAKDWYVSKVDGKIYNAKFIGKKQEEQKPTWSEEDEQMLNHITCDIESLKEEVVYCKTVCNEEIAWLKSLKERMKGK